MTTTYTSENVYQAIWDADQAANGVRPILETDTTTPRDVEGGYVIVDWPEGDNNPDHKVLQAGAVIPDKDGTYELCEALYNNYALKSSTKEDETEDEKKEIKKFIEAIQDTPPMKIAREYLDIEQTDDEWFEFIRERWFTIFGSNDRSGFEHVFVGENSGRVDTNIGGYHFWHKYYVDDGNGKVSGKDAIDFGRSEGASEGRKVPEVVTLNFNWDPEEESSSNNNILNKQLGGFWVGCSPEGLMALGMARWKQKTVGKTKAVINDALYEITLYTDVDRRKPENKFRTDDKYINTFWPKFEAIVKSGPIVVGPNPEEPPIVARGDTVRIIAALVNPVGDDVGFESVTLINISTATVPMNGWGIIDKNGNTSGLIMQLEPGEAKTITLSGAQGTVQLSNKGGTITLVDRNGALVDSVSYLKSQAKMQGSIVLF